MNTSPKTPRTSTDCAEAVRPNDTRAKGRPLLGRRLRSVNDVNFDGPSLRQHPLEHLLRWLLELWWHVKAAAIASFHVFFPRRDRVYGQRFDSTVIGRVTFGQKVRDEQVAVHHMRVELWARTKWFGYRKLGSAFTDRDGRFVITHDLAFVRSWWIHSVRVELYSTGNHRWHDNTAVFDFVLFEAVPILKGDLVGISYNVGTVQLFYWEYNYKASTPRVIIIDHDKYPPQRYRDGRVEAMERQLIPFELTKLEHLAEIDLDPGALSLPLIQADYPENLTVCMERHRPGSSRSDAWFGERMMNGMFASQFDRDPSDPSKLWVHYHWNSYDHTDDYALPDVDMWFELAENGLPMPVRIRLTGALTARDVDVRPRPKRDFTPADQPHWEYAKRVARVSGALVTELRNHFAGTHANVEQYAIAAYRNLRLSPLTTLLFPHIKEVALVNHTADQILIGKGYIQRATALTPAGIAQVIRHAMGTLDWHGYTPMHPLSDAHVYARASTLYWQMLREYVHVYVEQHAAGIRTHWFEVYRFSEDLVSHSVPPFLCSYLHTALHDSHGRLREADDHAWYLKEQRMPLPLDDRPIVHGNRRAVSSVTESPDAHLAPPADWERLKDLCTYVIFQATFGHTWANSKQYDDIGEVLYNSLGLRFGDGPDGVLAPESDYRIAPDLTRSTQMMWWSNMLSRTFYGFITRNEDGDINPDLINALESRRDAFAALGLDIDIIQSRTNI